MRLAAPTNGSKEGDRHAFCLDAEVGGIIDSPLTPVLWNR